VVAENDGLATLEPLGDGIDRVPCALCLCAPAALVALEAIGPILGALQEGSVFVVDLAGELEREVLALGGPTGGDELLELRCPLEAGRGDPSVGVCVKPVGGREP
jgi:hypothetical protein